MQYLPYDEVRISQKDINHGLYQIECPWLNCEFQLKGNINVDHLLHHLKSLPIAYQLPRKTLFGTDKHTITQSIQSDTPCRMAEKLQIDSANIFEPEWTWDAKAALKMSQIGNTKFYDPITLLTISRRFHYLDCSDNKMQELYDRVLQIQNADNRKKALATIVKQNHYVTVCCENSLEPALQHANSAQAILTNFIKSERGHDKLLKRSLTSLGFEAETCMPTNTTRALMTLLKRSAEINFVAFCFNLDFFEKPQFREQDSLAEVLTHANEAEAARGLQIHMNINDNGNHDAIANQLLSHVKAIDYLYAVQALRMAELTSFAIAQVPYDLEIQLAPILDLTH